MAARPGAVPPPRPRLRGEGCPGDRLRVAGASTSSGTRGRHGNLAAIAPRKDLPPGSACGVDHSGWSSSRSPHQRRRALPLRWRSLPPGRPRHRRLGPTTPPRPSMPSARPTGDFLSSALDPSPGQRAQARKALKQGPSCSSPLGPLPACHWPRRRRSAVASCYRVGDLYDGSRRQLLMPPPSRPRREPRTPTGPFRCRPGCWPPRP